VKRWLVVATALFLVTGTAAGADAPRTIVETWNPFGATRSLLTFTSLGTGHCGPGSEVIGDFGYRCGAGNSLADPCWRDGAAPTERVVCAPSPWASRVYTIRVPRLLFSAGVTFAAHVDARRDPPWALVLDDGNRCLLYQGAHGYVTTGRGRIVVDYHCLRQHVDLLGNLRRGRLWQIGVVRWTGPRYELLGTATVRRAIFASLPPAMQRQDDLAREAAAAVGLLDRVLLVRLSFPRLGWAFVRALAPATAPAVTTWRLLRRQGRVWRPVRLKRPPCRSRLPRPVRRQLFSCS
jgi:hypothetical protein